MRKQLIALAIAFALTAILIACGRDTGAPAYVEPAMEGFTAVETTSELITESALQAAENEPTAPQTEEATSFSAGTTTQKAATSTMQKAPVAQTAPAAAHPATTSTTARPVTAAQTTTTTTQRTTTTATAPPQTQPPKPVYTEADYAEIIAAVRAYAESRSLPFIWDTKLTYEYARSGMAGFHDVVNLNQNGRDGTIKTLKYNADLTEDVVTNPAYGVPSTQVHYNIVYFDYQGSTMFVLIYG